MGLERAAFDRALALETRQEVRGAILQDRLERGGVRRSQPGVLEIARQPRLPPHLIVDTHAGAAAVVTIARLRAEHALSCPKLCAFQVGELPAIQVDEIVGSGTVR